MTLHKSAILFALATIVPLLAQAGPARADDRVIYAADPKPDHRYYNPSSEFWIESIEVQIRRGTPYLHFYGGLWSGACEGHDAPYMGVSFYDSSGKKFFSIPQVVKIIGIPAATQKEFDENIHGMFKDASGTDVGEGYVLNRAVGVEPYWPTGWHC